MFKTVAIVQQLCVGARFGTVFLTFRFFPLLLPPSLTQSLTHSLTHSNLRASLIVVVCVQAMASAAGQELYHASLPNVVMSTIPFPIIHTREVGANSSWAPLRFVTPTY